MLLLPQQYPSMGVLFVMKRDFLINGRQLIYQLMPLDDQLWQPLQYLITRDQFELTRPSPPDDTSCSRKGIPDPDNIAVICRIIHVYDKTETLILIILYQLRINWLNIAQKLRYLNNGFPWRLSRRQRRVAGDK